MSLRYDTVSVRGVLKRNTEILVEWDPIKGISFLPGGRLEDGEELRAAIIRELAEEISNIQCTIGRYLGRILHYWNGSDGTGSSLNHFFMVEWRGGALEAKEAGRLFKWIDLNSSDVLFLEPPSLRRLLTEDKSPQPWDLEVISKMGPAHF